MSIGYKVTINKSTCTNNVAIPLPNPCHPTEISRTNSINPISRLASLRTLKNIATPPTSELTTDTDSLPMPDFQSVSVLSVNTAGPKVSGTFHNNLRESNKNITYLPLDASPNDTNHNKNILNDDVSFTQPDNNNDVTFEYHSENDEDEAVVADILTNSMILNGNSSMEQPSETNNITINVPSFEGTLKIHPRDPCYDLLQPKSFIAYTKIYNVLNQAKVPLYCYDLIVKTIGREILSGNFDPTDTLYSRKRYLKEINNQFPTPKPQVMPVHLDTRWNDSIHSNPRLARDTTEVIVFDFKDQLIDLLNDHTLFGNMSNLVVNQNHDDPESKWKPYNRVGNHIYEVLDGEWYQKYAKELITDYKTQFCCPIGLYIDASETVGYQRYSFQPLLMFPLILSCKARNIKTSSRVIALIPDLDAKSTAVKMASKQGGSKYKGISIRNYHKCMERALQSLKDCQRAGGVTTFLRLGNDIRRLQLKVPVAFILGDAKSQDHLCGRYGGHNTQRMCRACDVSFEDSDKTKYECSWIPHDTFHDSAVSALTEGDDKKDDRKAAFKFLHSNSQHALVNAFNEVDFAGFPRGIFGSTPHDLMHAFLEGVLKYCTRIFVKGFSTQLQAQIDQCVDCIFCKLRSSETPNVLRTNFTKGMTNLTMIRRMTRPVWH
jgi:hypothetical protein